jgi:hypothetical protein
MGRRRLAAAIASPSRVRAFSRGEKPRPFGLKIGPADDGGQARRRR